MLKEVDSHFLCPISKQIMDDPVYAADGYTYQREAIAEWLEKKDTSPLTNKRLLHRQLSPNRRLKEEIRGYLADSANQKFAKYCYLSNKLKRRFVTALVNGDLPQLEECLQQDHRLLCCVLEPGSQEMALHLAVASNKPEVVTEWVLKALLKIFPDECKDLVEKRNKFGKTPLHLILSNNRRLVLCIATFVVAVNSGTNSEDAMLDLLSTISLTDQQIQQFQQLKKEFIAALANADLSQLRRYLQQDQRLIIHPLESVSKNTALHYATFSKEPKIVTEWVLKSVSKFFPNELTTLINQQNVLGNTPLHFAVMNNNSQVIPCLLEHHAAIDIKNSAGYRPINVTPLELAKKLNNKLALLMLLSQQNTLKIEQLTKLVNNGTSCFTAEIVKILAKRNLLIKQLLMFCLEIQLELPRLNANIMRVNNTLDSFTDGVKEITHFFCKYKLTKFKFVKNRSTQSIRIVGGLSG